VLLYIIYFQSVYTYFKHCLLRKVVVHDTNEFNNTLCRRFTKHASSAITVLSAVKLHTFITKYSTVVYRVWLVTTKNDSRWPTMIGGVTCYRNPYHSSPHSQSPPVSVLR